ncbi:ATP-dependent DNA helicase RecG [Patescibacteria group bacterium]|nr:ATP-dependent DNA helicase RecG [Patescibacteria group bacterium]
MNLSTAIEDIPRIGPVYQRKLKRLGIKTVQDLFFHFPRRYEDFSNLIPISKVKINEISTIYGKILGIETKRTWKRKMFLTQAIIEDKTGAIKATWFNQPYLTKTLRKGDYVFLSGKTTISKNGIYLSNPIYEKGDLSSDLTHTGRLIPVYPETAGLSSRWIRYILKPLLIDLQNQINETLPEEIIKEYNLIPIKKALWEIHFPSSVELSQKAQDRFSFEELFYIQLFVLRERNRLNKEKSVSLPIKLETIQDLVKSLSFKLTNAQKKSAWQILKDLERPRPMNRLLEGDVGSGKTVVAAMAVLNTVKQGYQAAFMAPTEILSKQHFQEIARLLQDFKVNIGLLTGKQDQFRSKKLKNQVIEISRKKLLEKIANGEMDILIGTHALIQDKVKFGKLGLVVLDEQHRFGVEQRAKLCRKQDIIPHLLSMTATPIPRTLALTIYGDLDLSLIDELPKGRKKIITQVIKPEERKKTYDFIRKEVKKKRQVFVICPRIEKTNDNEQLSEAQMSWAKVKAVEEEYEKLSKEIFPDLNIGILHGKMATKEKENIMSAFAKGYGGKNKIDILVSTSVIEVGIDIPNATVMMIEGAERFGLAQLHQFRGRVGRARYQSYCLLFTDSHAKKTHQRLKALISSEDGFALAEKDLEIRGPGDFKGARQWGIPDLMMNSLKDISLVEKTRESAKQILLEDPQLKKYPQLLAKLGKFRERIHLE